MNYSPRDILDYIFEEKLDSAFFLAMMSHVKGYSIGEIMDKEIVKMEDGFHLISKTYKLDLPLQDEDVITAAINGLYVSAFLSRHEDRYQVHFLVHQYPEHMKSQFEEQITDDVVRYMILKTVLALRLDTKGKVKAYIEAVNNR